MCNNLSEVTQLMTKDKQLAGSQRTFMAWIQTHVLSFGPGCPSSEVIHPDDDNKTEKLEDGISLICKQPRVSLFMLTLFTVSVYRFLVDQIANEDIAQGPCLGDPCSTLLL